MRKPMTNTQRRLRTQRGFSLVELLIVVAVILVIASIAIPNFIRSRMRANESAAVQNLRNVTTANTIYLATYGIGFASNLTKLGGSPGPIDANNAGLIDSVLASGAKSGYSYGYVVTATDAVGNVVGFHVNAAPLAVGSTGENYFYTDETAIIRRNTTGTASSSDPPI
jgi:type IV pilus assembly protein PilA